MSQRGECGTVWEAAVVNRLRQIVMRGATAGSSNSAESRVDKPPVAERQTRTVGSVVYNPARLIARGGLLSAAGRAFGVGFVFFSEFGGGRGAARFLVAMHLVAACLIAPQRRGSRTQPKAA